MSIKGFIVNSSTQKYDYNELDNKPTINGIPSGGSAGQVLAKNSSTNYDVTWVNQSGGGGGGGTSDYSALVNKPQIEGVTLTGNKTADDLGLLKEPTSASEGDVLTYYNGDWTSRPSSGGSSSYDSLLDKPSINSVTLSGNKTSADLGLAASSDVHSIPSGGSTGQVLKKTSNSNYAVAWANESGGGSGDGLTEAVKSAILQLAEKVVYVDANGDTYYQDLFNALYGTATLSSITATYTQSGTVYDNATLDSLRSDLVVTAHYSNNVTRTISGYTLSGTLTVGTSTITVSYQGKTTTFNVIVTAYSSSYTITKNLTDCTISNQASTINSGESYSATLSTTGSYVLTTVTITMGGNDVTGTSYSSGTITIASVTGNIVITAVATERQTQLSSITAIFSQGSAVIYPSDSLNTLKQYLTVTAHWSDSTTSVVQSSDYTLSGTLTVGTSVITVSYGGKSDTFNVTVTSTAYNVTFTDGYLVGTNGVINGNATNYSTTLDKFNLDLNFSKIGVTYTFFTGDYGPYIAFYASDDTFVSRPNTTKTQSGNMRVATVSVPSTATKAVVSRDARATDAVVYKTN